VVADVARSRRSTAHEQEHRAKPFRDQAKCRQQHNHLRPRALLQIVAACGDDFDFTPSRTTGDLPPASSVTFFRLHGGPALTDAELPTAVVMEPVECDFVHTVPWRGKAAAPRLSP